MFSSILDIPSLYHENTIPPTVPEIRRILGESTLGYFQYTDSTLNYSWGYKKGASYAGNRPLVTSTKKYRPYCKKPPIAVLTSSRTSSLGEVVTVAFKTRPKTKSFGEHTAGYSTGNVNFTLSDGSMLSLATSVYTDR